MNVLPTSHNGIKFRSRTEARWAVFFDALGIKYVYEHEGYNLGDFFYLPDFWLPDHDFFVEIKGVQPTTDESAKASELANFTKKTVFIFCGTPRQPHDRTHYSESAYAFFPDGSADIQWWWCECQGCRALDVQFNGRAGRMHCCKYPDGDKDYQHDTPRLNVAYELAEKYEFWNPKGAGK